ncbi:hypothetical protein BGZ65_007818 [Modicella reniformis]|uniref:F-box domain-containing protein n=1 Tax=Modicella reniformis TaxID=1440133 RepID=A0A9P6IM45_9FUNG|nr:hypothetical protein BGZ65_007818 [Modicella reniformis]
MPTLRAIDLPEILFRIAFYLDAKDVIVCSLVCKFFHNVFTPFIWRDLHFGKRNSYKHCNSLTRAISLKVNQPIQQVPDSENKNKDEPRNPLLEVLLKNAESVRSLAIHNHDSVLPLTLGAACTRLESITLEGLSLQPQKVHPTEYWDECKLMIRQNRPHLRSLFLVNWPAIALRSVSMKGQTLWNPLLRCTHCWNLRSLSLTRFHFRGRYMKAFWTICERLEKLELERVWLELPKRPTDHQGGTTTNHPTQPTSRSSPPGPAVRFPRLLELTVREMQASSPMFQLEELIAQCPILRTLEWSYNGIRIDPSSVEFCKRFIASTWPDLSAVSINGYLSEMTTEFYIQVIKSVKQPLRQFDLKRMSPTPIYDILKTQHFKSLEAIDLRLCQGDKSDWVLEILNSCPTLQRFQAKILRAQDFLKAKKPWVCRQLQELVVFIDMGFPDNGPNRKLTEEELEQCRMVFRQLAILKELRVLDTLTTYNAAYNITHEDYHRTNHLRFSLVALPMRLNAGLDLLVGFTKLEEVSFWGGKHVVHKKELLWMIKHWKWLKTLTGGWRVLTGTVKLVQDKYFWDGRLRTWLSEQGIQTTGSRYEQYRENELDSANCGDCCLPQDEEPEENDLIVE